jgi:hypothetical protein
VSFSGRGADIPQWGKTNQKHTVLSPKLSTKYRWSIRKMTQFQNETTRDAALLSHGHYSARKNSDTKDF